MNTWITRPALSLVAAAAVLAGLASSALAQSTALTRAAELRADKVASSAVVLELAAGAAVQVVSLEGGWAQVQASGKSGWVRAGALNLAAGASAASGVQAGRDAKGNTALTLGVRSLGEPRSNRHALIIGINQYASINTPELPGVLVDRESTRQIAEAMQIPASSTVYVTGAQATGDGIRAALKALNERVREGDRVFIHYSGHGTSALDAGTCAEAWLAQDGAVMLDKEITALLSPLVSKTDKLFVMVDTSHSGAGQSSGQLAQGFVNQNDDGRLRAKFVPSTEACGKPASRPSRNLLAELVAQKATGQDIVFASNALSNDASFDDDEKGGLSTQFLRDCLLRDARDLNSSGAITLDEVKQCVQTKINARLKGANNAKTPQWTLTGNFDFVPARFHQAVAAPGHKP